jgi:hypothetical protein
MYTAQQLMSPQSQPYSAIYASPTLTQFQPLPPHLAGTYTTSAHQHVQYTPPGSQALPYNAGNQQLQQQQLNQTGSQFPLTQQGIPSDISYSASDKTQTVDISTSNKTQNVPEHSSCNEVLKCDDKTVTVQTRRSDISKPDTSGSKPDTAGYGSSVIADFAQQVSGKEPASSAAVAGAQSETGDTSVSEPVPPQDTSAVGFVIGHDETTIDQVYHCILYKDAFKLWLLCINIGHVIHVVFYSLCMYILYNLYFLLK